MKNVIMKQRSLANTYLYSMAFFSLLLTFLFGYSWIHKETVRLNAESEKNRENYISSQKEKIRAEVINIVNYIKYQKSLAEVRLKKDTKERTYQAYDIAFHIYEKNKASKPLSSIKKMVYDALYAVSWDDGEGYFFAEDMQGTELINRNNPELEGKNIIDLQDNKGNYLVKDIIAVAKSPQREGYCSYYWNKPEHPGVLVPKISFVKYFKPFDWVLGNGKYVDDEENEIKHEILTRLEKMRLDSDRYFFAGKWDGVTLAGPLKGKNNLNIEDVNGIRIVQKLIATAKNGGGFVGYIMPSLGKSQLRPKISYVMAMPDWEWYIGSGIHVDKIETVISEKQKDLEERIKSHLIDYGITLAIWLVIIFATVKLFSYRIRRNLESFSSFFSNASSDCVKIDLKSIHFTEFLKLAEYANNMIDRKQEAENAMLESNKKYRVLFDSSRDAIILSDPFQGLMDCNPAALEMFGIKNKNEILQLGLDLFSPKLQTDGSLSSEKAKIIILKAMEKGSYIFEWVYKRLPDTEFTASVLLTKIYFDNKPVLFGTIRNITEQKKTHEIIIQTEKMLSVGGLAAGMAHEINNPLAGLMQTADVLAQRLGKNMNIPATQKAAEEAGISLDGLKNFMQSRDVPRMLTAIKDSGMRIAKIVNNMLSFARKGDSQKSLNSITELLDRTLELATIDYDLNKQYDFKKIAIVREYESNSPPILCEASKIQQVILNLLRNGAQAMQDAETENPRFAIRTWYEEDQKMVYVEIEDNGPGINKNIRRRIFEPFFTTKAVGTGTGLGLSVSYFIITENHGGELVVVSEPGTGAKFCIGLPIE